MYPDNNFKISISQSIIDPLRFIGKNFAVITVYILFAGLLLLGIDLFISKIVFNNLYDNLPILDFLTRDTLSLIFGISPFEESFSYLQNIELNSYSYNFNSLPQLLNIILSTSIITIIYKLIIQFLLVFIFQILIIAPLLLSSYKNYINFGRIPNIGNILTTRKNFWLFFIKSLQIILLFVLISIALFILFIFSLAILIKLTESLFIFFIPLVILILLFVPCLIVVYFRANFILPAIASNKKLTIMKAYKVGSGANLNIFFVSIIAFITLAILNSFLHYSLELLFAILHTPKIIIYLYNAKVVTLFSQIFFGLVITSVFCQLYFNKEKSK